MKSIVSLIFYAGIAGFLLLDSSQAAESKLKVGDRAPAVSLTDHNGKVVTLEKLLKNGQVALVFYRSASW